MLNKADCLSILVSLEAEGLDVDKYIKELIVSNEIPTSVLQFIVKSKGIEVYNFYEFLRKKHNEMHSKLYTSILNLDNDSQSIIVTLTCLLTQVVLYAEKLDTAVKERFLKEARAEELTRVLNVYFKSFLLDDCLKELQLIRADLLVLEGLAGKRKFE